MGYRIMDKMIQVDLKQLHQRVEALETILKMILFVEAQHNDKLKSDLLAVLKRSVDREKKSDNPYYEKMLQELLDVLLFPGSAGKTPTGGIPDPHWIPKVVPGRKKKDD